MFSCLLMLIHNHKTALIHSQEKTAFPSKKKKKRKDCINNKPLE